MPVALSRPTPDNLKIRYSSGYAWLLAKMAALVVIVVLMAIFVSPEMSPVYVALSAVVASFWFVTWTTVDVEISRDRQEITECKMVFLGLVKNGQTATLMFNEIESVRTRLTITHRTDAYRVEVILRNGESKPLSVPYLGIKSCSDHAAKIAGFLGVPLSAPIEVTVRSGLFGSR